MNTTPSSENIYKNEVTELLVTKITESVVIDHSKDGLGIGAALLVASYSIYNEGEVYATIQMF